jgi:hypothetical protein
MIQVQTIIDRMKSALDAEGSDYYNFSRDFKPAINYALEWSVSVITPYLGQKKFPEELFRELTFSKIWQTSEYSRVNINPADLNNRDIWTILAIYPKPYVVVESGTDLMFNLPATYYNEIKPYLNQQVYNAPIVTQAWNATGLNTLLPHEGTFRPELSFLRSDKSCRRENLERYAINKGNPFAPGNISYNDDVTEYAYVSYTDYTAVYGGYKLTIPRELEIAPYIPNELVAVFYIHTPAEVILETDTIPFPALMMNVLVSKALNYISIKQNNGTNLRGTTDQELLSLLGAVE